MVFTDCSFLDNEANLVTPNFYLNRALDVQFYSCVFFSSDMSNTQFKGAFMQILAESSVRIYNSSFSGGHAIQGGALYMLGESEAFIENSIFTENIAQKRGGAISAESFKRISISKDSRFTGNRAINETGDILHAISSDYYVIIK